MPYRINESICTFKCVMRLKQVFDKSINVSRTLVFDKSKNVSKKCSRSTQEVSEITKYVL